MKVKVIKKTFYKERLIEEGQIIDFNEATLPTWAIPLNSLNSSDESEEQLTLLNPIETEKEDEQTEDEEKNNTENEDEVNEEAHSNSTNEEEDLQNENKLERYKDIGIENNVMLEIENMSVTEAIQLFEKVFKEKGINFEEN